MGDTVFNRHFFPAVFPLVLKGVMYDMIPHLGQIDQIDQIDHDIEHLDPSLPL